VTRAWLVVLMLLVGCAAFGVSLAIRTRRPGVEQIDSGPAAGVLGYVAAAFGFLVGFVIVFHLGLTGDARRATGDEATAIGTAFDEAQLFPEAEADLQHALICYSRSITEYEWEALAEGGGSIQADTAYRELIAAYGAVDEPFDRSFQAAAATNSFVQIGDISTARETRLVVAKSGIGPIMWVLMIGAAVFVLVLLFIVTSAARPVAQAVMLSMAAMFTMALLGMVVVFGSPFREGLGPVTPVLIEENTQRMVALAPGASEEPCSFAEA
jgi:hypothetical protein